MNILRSLGTGIVAGAFGTVVLDLTTYGDMAVRARGASSMPSTLVRKMAADAGIEALTKDDEATENRRQGVGAMLGYVNGLGVGALYGLFRGTIAARVPRPLAALAAGGLAMVLSDVPATKFGATDPATWSASNWMSDVIPHALYGIAVAVAFDGLRKT